jgi:hypothetical protein
MKLILPILLLQAISLTKLNASQTLILKPGERIKATISSDSMNRLSVYGDRITQVFGDSESYELQADENTGQIFLKPTSQNGNKPLAISVITESGVTQDLTLDPKEGDARTITLKAPITPATASTPNSVLHQVQIPSANAPNFNMGLGIGSGGYYHSLNFQEQVINAMKQMLTTPETLPTLELDSFTRIGPENLEIGLIAAYVVGNFKGFKLEVKNTSSTSIDILEKDFFRNGDVGISFEKRVLAKGESTICYVVSL